MQPIHTENALPLYEGKGSPFTCVKCGQGTMTPVIEEGEPDFTEHYACLQCGYHDTIPTLVIIVSQFTTALVGIGISTYLLINSFRPLLIGQTQGSALSTIEEFGLVATSVAFASGFVYVMYQSLKGYLQRRAYLRAPVVQAEPES